MKLPAFFFCILALPAIAQPPPVIEKTVTETVTPNGTVVEETVVEQTPPVVPVMPVAPPPRGFDPRRQLGVVPRALPVNPNAPAPGTTVETTETVTRVGGRVYNVERSVVVVEGRELPYTTVPVLFVKETAELLDSESRAALDQTAAAIKDILSTEPTAMFDIEGHTSTDGADEMNLNLSGMRAQRIYDELTKRYLIPPTALKAHGYGETYPMHPNGSEPEMMLDRRVLVVRVK